MPDRDLRRAGRHSRNPRCARRVALGGEGGIHNLDESGHLIVDIAPQRHGTCGLERITARLVLAE